MPWNAAFRATLTLPTRAKDTRHPPTKWGRIKRARWGQIKLTFPFWQYVLPMVSCRSWVTAAMWMARFKMRFPHRLNRCLVLPAENTSIGAVTLYVA